MSDQRSNELTPPAINYRKVINRVAIFALIEKTTIGLPLAVLEDNRHIDELRRNVNPPQRGPHRLVRSRRI